MDNSNVSIQISKDLVNPIIEAKIKGAILETLGGGQNIIEAVVNQVFSQKVNENGNVSSYSSDNKHRWVDVVITKQFSEIVKAAVIDWAKNNEPVIRKEIERQLSFKATKSAMVKSFVDGCIKNTSNGYNMKVSIEPHNIS